MEFRILELSFANIGLPRYAALGRSSSTRPLSDQCHKGYQEEGEEQGDPQDEEKLREGEPTWRQKGSATGEPSCPRSSLDIFGIVVLCV